VIFVIVTSPIFHCILGPPRARIEPTRLANAVLPQPPRIRPFAAIPGGADEPACSLASLGARLSTTCRHSPAPGVIGEDYGLILCHSTELATYTGQTGKHPIAPRTGIKTPSECRYTTRMNHAGLYDQYSVRENVWSSPSSACL
jgi:hypothetical protein